MYFTTQENAGQMFHDAQVVHMTRQRDGSGRWRAVLSNRVELLLLPHEADEVMEQVIPAPRDMWCRENDGNMHPVLAFGLLATRVSSVFTPRGRLDHRHGTEVASERPSGSGVVDWWPLIEPPTEPEVARDSERVEKRASRKTRTNPNKNA